jgi:predicted transcriptional regulator
LNALPSHEGNVEHLSSKLTYGKEQIEWRRAKVLDLSSQGYSQHEIATELQIAKGTVSSDLAYLRKQAQENLQYHIHDKIPEEYQNCMTGMKTNLKEILEIAQSTSDPKTWLQEEYGC